METKHLPNADTLLAGWEALRAGHWLPARALFEELLRAKETPEAFEGLSWAAWWLDDAETVFSAREHAFRLYKKCGDTASAARMATWLAADELDFHGAFAVASGWLRRAHRLLDPLEPGPDHGWLAFQDGYIANGSGDIAKARELAQFAAEIGRQFNVPDLEMLGLALEGSTLVSFAQVEEGLHFLDEATAVALEGEATIPISGAWTCCFLVATCTSIFDFGRAAEWCDRIAEFAQRYGSRYMVAFCRAEYGAIDLWRGQWTNAESLLLDSIDDFALSRPAWMGAPFVTLAELRRRQGRSADALALLDRAGPSGAGQLCRARMALDEGNPRRAIDLAQRVLRQLAPHRKVERFPALELLVEALVAFGDMKGASDCLVELRATEKVVGTLPMRASVDLAEGMLAAASGAHDRARELFEDAIDLFERSGAPYETALTRLQLATTQFALGRNEAVAQEAQLAATCFQALGATELNRRARNLISSGDLRSPEAGMITNRERDVLCLLARGMTNRQIAAQLSVSDHTIHRHVTNILRKLDLPSRTAAAAYAVQSGLAESARA
jgi:DNA-binding CsgD family transcriptional regulator